MTASQEDASPRAKDTPSPGGYVPNSGMVLRVLTGVQNVSGMAFAAFAGIHLISPLVASFAGIPGADRSLLLSRTYFYHLSEPLLVFIPLYAHVAASTLKRILIGVKTKRVPQPTLSMQTGYPLIALVLAHVFVHRLIPASPQPPIASLSPSELGYDFVAYGLTSRPWTSVAAYLSLAGLLIPHAWVGWEKAWPWAKRQLGLDTASAAEPSRRSRRAMWGLTIGVLGVLAISMSRLYEEGGAISSIMRTRYEAVFDRLPWERTFPRIFGLA